MNIELGSNQDLIDSINKNIKLFQETKSFDEQFFLYQYINDCYYKLDDETRSSLDINFLRLLGRKKYRKLEKRLDICLNRPSELFIRNKDYHSNLFLCFLGITQEYLVQFDSIRKLSNEGYFTEEDFSCVLHDFLKSIKCESLFDEYRNKKIFDLSKNDLGIFDGMAEFNNATGEGSVFIEEFDYSYTSMDTIVHELGHIYDFKRVNKAHSLVESNNYLYNNVYVEAIPRLFEIYFNRYCYKNNIMKDCSNDTISYSILGNYEDILAGYLLCFLKDNDIVKDKYLVKSKDYLCSLVFSEMEKSDYLERFINRNNFNILTNTRYAYGDVMSRYLSDSDIFLDGDNPLVNNFLDERVKPFSKTFFQSNGLNSENYGKILQKELNMLKK